MPIRQQYQGARRRLLLFDYDGTLVDFAPTPAEAKPTSAMLRLLGSLTADPRNTVVIISGRDHATLEDWLGHLPVAMAAEHGLFIKAIGSNWRPTRVLDQSWKPPIRALMANAAVPGAFIEEKTLALVWHYRNCDPRQATPLAPQLTLDLARLGPAHGLKIMPGHKIIEVMPTDINKGRAAKHWLVAGDYDFILAAGDDTTDEDLFRALPPEAHAIKVGSHSSNACTIVPSPTALHRYLKDLIGE